VTVNVHDLSHLIHQMIISTGRLHILMAKYAFKFFWSHSINPLINTALSKHIKRIYLLSCIERSDANWDFKKISCVREFSVFFNFEIIHVYLNVKPTHRLLWLDFPNFLQEMILTSDTKSDFKRYKIRNLTQPIKKMSHRI
jgi:hypothetical protein